MTVEDVHEQIFQRMLAVYPPPTHLRVDRQARELALRDYEQALARFSPATLERAWLEVVAAQTFWCWPVVGELATACARIEPHRLSGPSPEEVRRQQAWEMTETFVSNYRKKAHLAKVAREEGWLAPLTEYVHASARVQAQLVTGVQNIGFNARILTSHLGAFHSSDEAFAAFRSTLGDHLERGEIKVSVPRTLLAAWKKAAREQPTPPLPLRDPFPPR